jgi:hypothetical protein
VEHKPLAVLVEFPTMDTPEQLALHSRVAIHEMKAAVAVVVTSAVAVVVTTQVVLADLVMLHF